MNGRPWSKTEIVILEELSKTTPIADIARGLGRHYTTVKQKAKALGLKVKKKGEREVAVYRNDDLLAVGTLKECAEITGLSYQTIMCYLSPSFKHKKTNITVVLIEDDEHDEETE